MALETSYEKPVPVRVIAQAVSGYVDRLGPVWVEGQVAQLTRRPTTSTVFVVLRDPVAEVSVQVTCSRAVFDSLAVPVTEGARVVIHAKFQYYVPRGTLSLVANEIRPVGVGELLARIEQRRQLLAAEGLFDPARKRPLPFLPRTVGLIVGRSSAAERDVLDNARHRWPGVVFTIEYAVVQGHDAARQVIEALGVLERDADVDVIVIARGGGSLEDLLPFSDEGLLRAVAGCRTAVVSAIGHEPDQPLLDLVARCPGVDTDRRRQTSGPGRRRGDRPHRCRTTSGPIRPAHHARAPAARARRDAVTTGAGRAAPDVRRRGHSRAGGVICVTGRVATLDHRLDTERTATSSSSSPRVRGLSPLRRPCAAGTAWLQDHRRAIWSTEPGRWSAGATSWSPGSRPAACTSQSSSRPSPGHDRYEQKQGEADEPRTNPRTPQSGPELGVPDEPSQQAASATDSEEAVGAESDLTYEEARDQLVVRSCSGAGVGGCHAAGVGGPVGALRRAAGRRSSSSAGLDGAPSLVSTPPSQATGERPLPSVQATVSEASVMQRSRLGRRQRARPRRRCPSPRWSRRSRCGPMPSPLVRRS